MSWRLRSVRSVEPCAFSVLFAASDRHMKKFNTYDSSYHEEMGMKLIITLRKASDQWGEESWCLTTPAAFYLV